MFTLLALLRGPFGPVMVMLTAEISPPSEVRSGPNTSLTFAAILTRLKPGGARTLNVLFSLFAASVILTLSIEAYLVIGRTKREDARVDPQRRNTCADGGTILQTLNER